MRTILGVKAPGTSTSSRWLAICATKRSYCQQADRRDSTPRTQRIEGGWCYGANPFYQ